MKRIPLEYAILAVALGAPAAVVLPAATAAKTRGSLDHGGSSN